MSATDVTFGRALKIWWSFVWRATVLMLPVMIVAMVIAVSILPFPKARQPAPVLRPDQIPGMTGEMFGLWLFMMVFYIAAGVNVDWIAPRLTLLQVSMSDLKRAAMAGGIFITMPAHPRVHERHEPKQEGHADRQSAKHDEQI